MITDQNWTPPHAVLLVFLIQISSEMQLFSQAGMGGGGRGVAGGVRGGEGPGWTEDARCTV